MLRSKKLKKEKGNVYLESVQIYYILILSIFLFVSLKEHRKLHPSILRSNLLSKKISLKMFFYLTLMVIRGGKRVSVS